jgi:hypothetical protein
MDGSAEDVCVRALGEGGGRETGERERWRWAGEGGVDGGAARWWRVVSGKGRRESVCMSGGGGGGGGGGVERRGSVCVVSKKAERESPAPTHAETHTHTHTSSPNRREGWAKRAAWQGLAKEPPPPVTTNRANPLHLQCGSPAPSGHIATVMAMGNCSTRCAGWCLCPKPNHHHHHHHNPPFHPLLPAIMQGTIWEAKKNILQ